MTKKQAEKQIREMIKELDLLAECRRLINSGAIDISQDSLNDYSHTKTVLKVALENVAANLPIYSLEIKKDYKNLQNF